MRYIALTIAVVGLMSCSFLPGDRDIAESEVPSVVRNAFSSEYPNAKDIDWEMKGEDYEVDFEVENVDHSVLLNSSGKIIMQKEDITREDLPEAVMAGINSEFANLKLDGAERVEKDGKTFYQVELDGTFRDKEVIFTADGKQDKSFSFWD